MKVGHGRTHPIEVERAPVPFDSTGRREALPKHLEDVLQVLTGAWEGNTWYTEALGKSRQGQAGG